MSGTPCSTRRNSPALINRGYGRSFFWDSYECAQIVGPGNTGDVVPTGSFQFQRAYPGVPTGQATFGTLRCAHLAGVKFYKLDMKLFTVRGQERFLPYARPAAAC
jgi:hypothetical protein